MCDIASHGAQVENDETKDSTTNPATVKIPGELVEVEETMEDDSPRTDEKKVR